MAARLCSHAAACSMDSLGAYRCFGVRIVPGVAGWRRVRRSSILGSLRRWCHTQGSKRCRPARPLTQAGRLVERERPPGDAVNAVTWSLSARSAHPPGSRAASPPQAWHRWGGATKAAKRCLFLGGGVGWVAGRARGGGVPSGVPPTRPACLLGADQVYRAPVNTKGSEAWRWKVSIVSAALRWRFRLMGCIA
jgi:hypothetical protein